MINKCFELIEQQQGTDKRSPVYCVGEQLKDILQSMPADRQELVAIDLEMEDKTLGKCEKKIQDFAKKNGSCTPGAESDRIVREFYGLLLDPKEEKETASSNNTIDFASLL